MKKHAFVLLLVFGILAGSYIAGHSHVAAPPIPKHATTKPKTVQPKPTVTAFNKAEFSIDSPASIWVVVNKQRPLNPITYAPNDLVVPNIPLRTGITANEQYVRKEMAAALEGLEAAAKIDGVTLNLQSGYRSYTFQEGLYNGYVKQSGQAQADLESARAGHSEHQTGWAADLGGVTQPSCNIAQCFGETTEGKWLAANAYKYGFIIRYTATKQAITGYENEPWHVRYVGSKLSQEMFNDNITTLEEFFGLPAAPTYN